MYSNLSIGPSFQGTISVKVVKELKGKTPIFGQHVMYKTTAEQDFDSIMFVGGAMQDKKENMPIWVGKLFNYLNKQQLVDDSGKSVLKLDPSNTKDYSMSIVGTHSVITKAPYQVNDVNIEMFSEIFA